MTTWTEITQIPMWSRLRAAFRYGSASPTTWWYWFSEKWAVREMDETGQIGGGGAKTRTEAQELAWDLARASSVGFRIPCADGSTEHDAEQDPDNALRDRCKRCGLSWGAMTMNGERVEG